MERRLREEEVVTIEVLHERGMSNRGIARQLGVSEHAVRYRLRRRSEGRPDGRAAKPLSAEPWSASIAQWMGSSETYRGVNGRALYEWLVAEHGYPGSYKAIQRFLRARYAKPRLRVRRRVETPPGGQAQADGRLGNVPGSGRGGRREGSPRLPPGALALPDGGNRVVGEAGRAGLALGA